MAQAAKGGEAEVVKMATVWVAHTGEVVPAAPRRATMTVVGVTTVGVAVRARLRSQGGRSGSGRGGVYSGRAPAPAMASAGPTPHARGARSSTGNG
eukprot:6126591-Prymnesium_polylepis.1